MYKLLDTVVYKTSTLISQENLGSISIGFNLMNILGGQWNGLKDPNEPVIILVL